MAVMNRKHLIFPNEEMTKCGIMIAKIIIQTSDLIGGNKKKGLNDG
jgi:thiamine biosynthesis protein ThiC